MDHRSHYSQALVSACLVAAAGCAHADLIVNGGFEGATFVDSGSHFSYLSTPQLTGWTSFAPQSGTLLFNSLWMPVAGGSQAVEIERPGDFISQSFATIVGMNYHVSFDLSAYTGYGGPGLGTAPCPCDSLLFVSAGPASGMFGSSSTGYVTRTLDFTADSGLTTLKFMNPSFPSTIGNFPHLDNVSVVQVSAVPEPESLALLLGGLAALSWRARSMRRSPQERATA